MTQYYHRSLVTACHDRVTFPFSDKKGRRVGYRWVISSACFTPRPDVGGYTLPEGMPLQCFAVEGKPTRSGIEYGAFTGYVFCATFAEAEKVVARRIEQARKRDAKKFEVRS